MVKDKRYNALKHYLNSGEAKNFREIFDIIPKTRIASDAGINPVRLTKKITNPDKFSVRDIIILSDLFDVDGYKIYNLIAATIDKKSLRKKNK